MFSVILNLRLDGYSESAFIKQNSSFEIINKILQITGLAFIIFLYQYISYICSSLKELILNNCSTKSHKSGYKGGLGAIESFRPT